MAAGGDTAVRGEGDDGADEDEDESCADVVADG